MSTKRCSHCHQTIAIGCFWLNASEKDGLDHTCIACHRAWHIANPVRHRARVRKWISRNPKAVRAHGIAFRLYPVRKTCAVVGCEAMGERHHPDYRFPKEIIWLCRKHHAREGKKQ
jgi:hypothetical protein